MPLFHIYQRIQAFRWLLLGAAIFFMACSPRKLIVNEMVQVMETGMAAMERDDDLPMLEKAFPAHIKQLEGLLISTPENGRLLVMLAQSYAAYCFIFFDGDLEYLRLTQQAASPHGELLRNTLNQYYQKGMDYALKAMEVNHPESRRQLKIPSQNRSFLKSLTTKDVPALFWYAFNLSAYINANVDSLRALAKAHLAEAAMQRVIELDENYYHGLAHLVLMAYYGSRSPAMGGNLKLAMAHYNRLQDITKKQLWLTDVYLARFVLYQKQNRQQFIKILQKVVEHPESAPSYRLLNQTARMRAQIYLDTTDRLFEEP